MTAMIMKAMGAKKGKILMRSTVMAAVMTNLSLDEIGKVFDNRDHSTVLYSIQQIEKKMKKDAAFAEMVKEIKTNINSKR